MGKIENIEQSQNYCFEDTSSQIQTKIDKFVYNADGQSTNKRIGAGSDL